MLLFPLLALAASAQAFVSKVDVSIAEVPSTVYNGSTYMNSTSGFYGLDGPQISAVNNASYDWWYFDAISPDTNASVVVVFYTANASAFFFIDPVPTTIVAAAYVTFENGSRVVVQIPASEAIITSRRQGASGDWVGTGARFTGAADLSSFMVEFDSPKAGIVGTFALDTIAPAHYACGPAAGPNQNILVAPSIGWSNAVPDADGTVNMTVAGVPVIFKGPAYHDKNWGDVPWQRNLQGHYWGHGRLDKYSIVWYSVIDLLGVEHIGAYAAADGELLTASCRPDALLVRPWGNHSEYPPTAATGDPDGFNIAIQIPCGTLNINVTNTLIIGTAGPVYTRFRANLTGRLNGGPQLTGGIGLLEVFKFVGFPV